MEQDPRDRARARKGAAEVAGRKKGVPATTGAAAKDPVRAEAAGQAKAKETGAGKVAGAMILNKQP